MDNLHGPPYLARKSPLEPPNPYAHPAQATSAPAAPTPRPPVPDPANALKPWDARQLADLHRDLIERPELLEQLPMTGAVVNEQTLDALLPDVVRDLGQAIPDVVATEVLRRRPELLQDGESTTAFTARVASRLKKLNLLKNEAAAALSLYALLPTRRREVAQEVSQQMARMMGAAFSLDRGFADDYRPDGQAATDPVVAMLNEVDATLEARRRQALDEMFAAAGYFEPTLTKEQIAEAKALFARAAHLMRCGHNSGRLKQACDNLRQVLDGSTRGSPQALAELKGAVEALEWSARGWPAL
jgi:hypothetical protein